MQSRYVAVAAGVVAVAVVVVASAPGVMKWFSGPDDRPSVVVRDGDTKLTIRPYTFCGESFCADGLPPRPLPDLGVVDGDVTISVARSDWKFSATQVHPPKAHFPCAETIPADIARLDANTWRLSPAGPADRYAVRLAAETSEMAMSLAFAMTTDQRGNMPTPTAWAQVFNGTKNAPKIANSLALTLQHLAATPEEAAATLTVRGSEGQVSTYRLTPARQDCWARGTAYLRARSAKTDVVRMLGSPPYDLRWVLHLDGNRYVARAVWPRDQRGVDFLIYPKVRPSLPSWPPRS